MKHGRFEEILGIVISICMMIISACGDAWSEINLGRLKIYPELSLTETYRSNIYQTQSDTKSDFITTTRPGIRLDYQFGARHSLTMEYNAGWLSYARYSKNNYWDQRANGLLKLDFAGGLEFTLGNRFTKSVLEQTATVGRQRPYQQNITDTSLAYRFADRWKAQAKYSRDAMSFDHYYDRTADYLQDLFGGVMYYRFTGRTAALLEYDRVMKNFDRNDSSNSKSDNVYFGLTFDPAGKLQGEFKAGYGWKKFVHDVANRDNSPKTWIVLGNVTQNFTPYTSLSFLASRQLNDDTDFGNASYENTRASATLQHFFTGKLGGTATATYQLSNYLDNYTEPVTNASKKRKDNRWELGGGMIYKMQKWLEVRLEYQYINKQSNFETYSFDENRVLFKIAWTP